MMKKLIKKKLLGKVLGYEIVGYDNHVDYLYDPYISINYKTIDNKDYEGGNLLLNIYELQNMLKDWAWKEHTIRLSSGRMYGHSDTHSQGDNVCIIDVFNGHPFYNNGEFKNFIAKSELDSVIKACEYIYKETK